jgi:hypothetical protein
VDKLNKQMIQASESEDWSGRLTSAGNDKKKLQNVLIPVLSTLKDVMLEMATLQKIAIARSRSQVIKLVESLNENEVEELKNLVWNGNWVGLITHHMWLSPLLKMIYL